MKSVGVAYLLWFFFGFFGIHRFYLDRPGTGLLWLFTAGLCGIVCLIPSMTEDCNAMYRQLPNTVIISNQYQQPNYQQPSYPPSGAPPPSYSPQPGYPSQQPSYPPQQPSYAPNAPPY